MSVKISPKRLASNAIVRESTSKVADQKKDIKYCLKLLDNGELQLVDDISGIDEELSQKPHLGDHIQYELHKYCQRDLSQTNVDVVVKLAELCYSPISVLKFCNIDRFVGCVYYICGYLLKREQYKCAVHVICSLEMRRDEILKVSEEKADVRTFLCNLHSSFIAAAIVLASKLKSNKDENYKISHDLAVESLKIFQFTNTEQMEAGKKVLKTTMLYLQTVKHYRQEDIFQFCKLLNDVLRILLPKMGNTNFCLYYLSKVNQLKKLESEEEVVAMLKKTIHFLLPILNSSAQVMYSMNKITDDFFSRSWKSDWINGEDFEFLGVKHPHSQFYFLLVSTIFSYGVQFLWKKFEKNWYGNISSELVKNLAVRILHFHKCYCKTKAFYCSSSKGPFESCFGSLLTGNLQKIQYTIRLCLKHKIPNAMSLVPVSQNAFKLSIECLQYMELGGCCQEHRSYSWTYSVIHHTNTIEDICRHEPSDQTWVSLKECSQEVLRQVVSSKADLPFDFKRINILFQRWHTACLKLKNYRDALYACVVYYVFYPDEEKEIISMWLQTKFESRNEIIEDMTMSEILRACDKDLREFSPAYNSSKIILKSLLLMELKAYSTCHPDIFQNPNTSYHLAVRIYKQLEKSRPDMWERSLALSFLISANVAGDNTKLPPALQEKCKKLIDELMNWKGETQGRNLVHVANLTFSLFLYNVKLAESSEGKMDTSHMILGYLKKAEEEKVKFGEDVDLNLTCDVIPSSSHLTVALETNYLNELNKIVDLWNGALKNDFENLPSPLEFNLWQQNVKQVAHLYKLFGEYQRAFTTWLMFYKIGKLRGNSAAILLGLSHVIENCSDVDESGIKEEAEIVSGKLGSEASEKYVVVEYTLAVASNYLKNKKADKCLEYLTLAKKVLEGLRTTLMTYALNAKFWCLVNRFLVLYKEYEAVFEYPPGTDLRVMAFKAFSYANGAGRSDLIKTAAQSECMELILAMLDVNLWAYHLHGVYRQTDFMRFFLDDLYQIVQKLFLPTRTAEMLVRLAEVDLMCEKVEDCQGKITKLKSILTTLPSTCTEVSEVREARETLRCEEPSPYLSVPERNEFDVPSLRPMSPARFLDQRPQTREPDLSPFHYYLDNGTNPSKGSEHLGKCKCRLCQNLLIQTLTLNIVWLEAEMYNLNNNSKKASQCYNEGYGMLHKVELLRAEQSKLLRVTLATVLKEVPGELDFQLAAIQFHSARFLIRYAMFESSSLRSVTESVLKIMLRVSKLMKKFSYETKLLQWSFAELKLCCVVLSKGDSRPPKKTSPVQVKAASNMKTPVVAASSTTTTNGKAKKIMAKGQTPEVKVQPDEEINEAMNTAFVGTDKMHSFKKVMQPRKLNFGTNEPEVNTRTVRKVQKEKTSSIHSRRLNFDVSRDLFDEANPYETMEKAPCQQKESSKAPKPRKDKTDSVKVYVDSREDSRRKKTTNLKAQSRTRKI